MRCTSWDPDAWPRTCATYECDAECEAGDPGGGGSGNQPPSISHTLTCTQNGLNSWCMGALSIDLTASDPQNVAVVISGDVSGDPSTSSGQAFTCTTNPCNIPLPEGSGLVTYKADSATGLSASGSAFYYRDVTTPQISGSVNGSSGTNGWYITQTLVNASAADALSGLASLEVNVDNNGWVTYSDTTFTDGIHAIQFRAYDNAGNYTETAVQEIKVDTAAPALNVAITGTTGTNGWYISNVTLTPTASDPSTGSGQASGLASLEASIDGAPFTNYGSPITLTDGIHTLQFRATDNAGNMTQTAPQEIKVDATTPSLSLNISGTRGQNDWYVSAVSVTPNASDAGSSIHTIEAKINGGAWVPVTSNQSSVFSDGIHTYQYRVTDQAGNVTEMPALPMRVDTVPPAVAIYNEPLALGDTLIYDLEDSLSGLWINRAVIEDDAEKYKKIVWLEELSGMKVNDNEIRWDGIFADGKKAEPGQYFITLKISDQAGNESIRTATVEVTAFNALVPIPAFVPPVNVIPEPVPGGSAPTDESAFGGETNQAPAEQTTTVTEGGAQATLEGMSLQAGGTTFAAGNQSTNSQATNTNILWGAAAAATLGATLAEWQRRREEEEAARRAAMFSGGGGDEEEEASDVTAKKRAKVMAKNQAKRDQESRWEAARTAQNQKKDEAIEAAWNQSRRTHSLKSMSATIHANAVRQANEMHRQGERESVVQGKQEQGKNIFQKITSAVTPFLQDASQQLYDLNANITKPSNSTGPLFGSEKYNNVMSTIQGLGVLIDNGLFNGKIQQTANNLKQYLETNPTYNTRINTIEFGIGAAFQYMNDNSFGLFEKVLHVNWENGGDAFQSGRQLGRTASNIQGAVEFVTGAAAAAFFLSSIPPTGGLTAACAGATGGLCLPIGVIAIPVELALAGASAAVSAHGSAMLANNYNNRSEIRGNGGGRDLSPNPEKGFFGSNAQEAGENARRLFKNMKIEEPNIIKPDGYAAHHIVPAGSQRPAAIDARQILEKFGIDINNAGNGAIIPGNVNSSLNNKYYEQAILKALKDAESSGADQTDILMLLQDIGDQIKATGKYP